MPPGAVEWPVADGGNGHYYLAVATPSGTSWNTAKTAAEAVGGYLVTIASSAENAFVYSLVGGNDSFWYYDTYGTRIGPWLGGYQPAGSSEPAGGWRWVTEEPFDYTNWSPGEPNNSGNEWPLNLIGTAGKWNDMCDCSVNGYIVEFSTGLTVTKSDSADPVLTGATLTYTVTVANAGPGDATNVQVADTLPGELTFVSTSGCAEDGSGGGVPTCTLGTIAASTSKSYTITTTVNDLTSVTTIANTASASSDTPDANPGDEQDTEETKVIPASDGGGDDIPDAVDCSPRIVENLVVDPDGELAGILAAGRRFTSLQAAVVAAADNDTIGVYGDTTENVVIGGTTGSGGKDLRIIGCGHSVTAGDAGAPVITVEASAGANDGDTGDGAKDISIVHLTATGGTVGYLVATVGPAPTKAELRAPAAASPEGDLSAALPETWGDDDDSVSEGPGESTFVSDTKPAVVVDSPTNTLLLTVTASGNGVGIRITGKGTLVRHGAVANNTGNGIEISGEESLVAFATVQQNGGSGIAVTGAGNTLSRSVVGGGGLKNSTEAVPSQPEDSGNGVNGIQIDSNGNRVDANEVYGNAATGIQVTGTNNQLLNNRVGTSGAGNGADGIWVAGGKNRMKANRVYANAGDGIEVSGGTANARNALIDNRVGAAGKGNGGNGILVDGNGNGAAAPIEIQGNRTYCNGEAGVKVIGTGHQLKGNTSGGDATEDNVGCEFDVASGNANTTLNMANDTEIAGAQNSPFPTGCQGTPPPEP